jgi:hypothetical protein
MDVGLGLLSTPIIVGLQYVVDWNRRGVVTRATMFTRQLGQAVGAAVFGGIANSALASWLSHAPQGVSGYVSSDIDSTSRLLGGSVGQLDGDSAEYLRRGLYLATHQVFVALVVVAIVGIIVLLVLTPRRFERLRFEDEDWGLRGNQRHIWKVDRKEKLWVWSFGLADEERTRFLSADVNRQASEASFEAQQINAAPSEEAHWC